MKNKEFHRLLRERGMTVTKLARMANVGRTSLSSIISGQRAGKFILRHIDPFLTPEERDVLHSRTKNVSKATMLHVEHTEAAAK